MVEEIEVEVPLQAKAVLRPALAAHDLNLNLRKKAPQWCPSLVVTVGGLRQLGYPILSFYVHVRPSPSPLTVTKRVKWAAGERLKAAAAAAPVMLKVAAVVQQKEENKQISKETKK